MLIKIGTLISTYGLGWTPARRGLSSLLWPSGNWLNGTSRGTLQHRSWCRRLSSHMWSPRRRQCCGCTLALQCHPSPSEQSWGSSCGWWSRPRPGTACVLPCSRCGTPGPLFRTSSPVSSPERSPAWASSAVVRRWLRFPLFPYSQLFSFHPDFLQFRCC